ncbi:hypothetical protein B296_00053132 [Ensete ventricosum]|uniref:Uncharacterized protein n=1 Tax=Ensete ventricosum TaxID=4639 RepID=A0A426XQP2_ENSVE|nr:hypothetical protein B296_00053132 [Ensete ventricosum]
MLLTATIYCRRGFLGGNRGDSGLRVPQPVAQVTWVQPPIPICGPTESSCRRPSFMGGPPPVGLRFHHSG